MIRWIFFAIALTLPIFSNPEHTPLDSLDPNAKIEVQKIGREAINFIRWKKIPLAEKKLSELSPAYQNNEEYYYIRGAIAFAKKDLNWAEDDLKTSLQINPKHEPSLYLLGMVHSQWGNWTEAKTAFLQAVEISPYNPYYFMNLALVQFVLEDYEASKDNATKAIQLKANYSEAKVLSIQIQRILQNRENAYRFAEKLHREEPLNRDARFVFAELVYETRFDFQKVIALLEKEKNLPHSTRRVLAQSYSKTLHYVQAEPHWKALAESGSATEEDQKSYLETLFAQEQFFQAEEFARSIRLEVPSQNETIRKTLATLYKEKNARDKLYYFFPLQ